MVLDSSAIVAIHLKEPGHDRLIEAIDDAEVVVVGVPTLLETAMVLTARLGQDARPLLFAFLRADLRPKWSRLTKNIWMPPPPHFCGLDGDAIPRP